MKQAAFGGAGYVVSQDEPTVEEILEKGLRLSEASPVHIAFRGAASKGSFRCAWRGVARTAGQREGAIRLWLGIEEDDPLPPAADIENQMSAYLGALGAAIPWFRSFLGLARGGLVDEYQFLTCYADYRVQEYLLGSGPDTVTVAYDHLGTSGSYELYTELHAVGLYGGGEPQGEDEYAAQVQDALLTIEATVAGLIGDRESVVFLAPMGAHHAIAVEAWLAVAQWDLQIGESNGIDAVRYGTRENDPEHRQPLGELRSRIRIAGESDAFAGKRIPNVEGLTSYYESIGAYDIIGPYNVPRAERTPFVPAKPPPPRAEAPLPALKPTPGPVERASLYFVSVSSGTDNSCGINADGSVICWGSTFGRTAPGYPHKFKQISVSTRASAAEFLKTIRSAAGDTSTRERGKSQAGNLRWSASAGSMHAPFERTVQPHVGTMTPRAKQRLLLAYGSLALAVALTTPAAYSLVESRYVGEVQPTARLFHHLT